MKAKKMIKKKKYDIIYSIGYNCACALYLNKNNLRMTSGPFDWVSEVSFKDRIHLILNNFEDYLKLSDLKRITPSNEQEKREHEVYKNEKLGYVFPHDFALNTPIEKTYPDVLQKYQRRINRFFNNIIQKQKILLVWFSLDLHVTHEEILDASNKLRKKFNKDIDILVIENNDELFNKGIQIEYLNEHSTKISLFAKKLNDNAEFTKGNIKLCNKIFKTYSLNTPLIKKCKIILTKLICKLIPIKSKRKYIRNVLLYDKN